MTSWKLCFVLLLSVLFVLVFQVASGKVRGSRRRQGNDDVGTSNRDDSGDDDVDEAVSAGTDVTGRGGLGPKSRGRQGGSEGRNGRQRQGGRRGSKQGRGNRRRQPSKSKMAKLLKPLSSSLDGFSISVYNKMAEVNSNNFVFSPFSVYSALSMLMLGTSGSTKRELSSGLGTKSSVHKAFMAYNGSLELDIDDNTTLAVANNLYVKAGLKLNAPFVQKIQRFYGSSAEPFQAVNPEDTINGWVEDKTQGEISEFLRQGEITPDMVVMLINAVYFKGIWKNRFTESRTQPLPFFVTPSDSVSVAAMTQSGQFLVSRSSALGATILELPYEGDRFAAFIVLPNTNLSDVESRLNADLLTTAISEVTSGHLIEAYVQVPKFGLDTEQSMKEILEKIGITRVFNPQRASFRKMTREPNIYVNKVKHRAVIEVDEEGTVAAGVTSIGFMKTSLSLPIQVIVNRPFLFVLRDKEHGINLFLGRYTNPQGDNLKA